MKRSLALMPLLLAATALYAQPSIEGSWQLSLAPPDQETMTIDVMAWYNDDVLTLVLSTSQGEMPLDEVRLDEETLLFTIPTGHGAIICTLYAQGEDAFSGICAGQAGESPTTLKRKVPDED